MEQSLDVLDRSKQELDEEPFKDIVFNEVMEHLHSLIVDVFGNYVIQKLLEFGSK